MEMMRCGESAARRRLRQGGLLMASNLSLMCGGLALYLWHHTPSGSTLFALAALPSLFLAGMVVLVGRYLRDESHGPERERTVQILLMGTGALLIVSTFLGFLRLFGWAGREPRLLELSVFCWAMVLARGRHRLAGRVRDDA